MRYILVGLAFLALASCPTRPPPPKTPLCGPLVPPHLVPQCRLWV
jgi:hypothetical protein